MSDKWLALVAGGALLGCLGLIALNRPAASEASAPAPNITREQLGEEWPLSVDGGILRCRDGADVTFEHGGVEYALNGMASGSGYPEIDPIWSDDPDPSIPKKSIAPLIEAGRRLCD